MEIRPHRVIKRKKTKEIKVGNISVGGNSVISVQSMTNTLTTDVESTINQINSLAEAGADIVRVSCPDESSTQALKKITKNVSVPIVADIHFHYKRAIEAAENGASCIRINPGNIGSKERIKEVIKAAKDYDCAIRIGVNAGSLEKNILDKYKEPTYEALVESALFHASILQEQDFHRFKISVKASNALLSIAAYSSLSEKIDCPLHVGITEAGSFRAGTVKSSIGIGNLLLNGIGDTIRVSLSSDPCDEVRVGFDILKSLGLRQKGVTVISCPSCARQQFDVISTVREIEEQLDDILTPITVSIIGCVVNGPGEARSTDVGITGGGKGTHQIYVNGIPDHVIKNQSVVDHVVNEVRKKLSSLN